MKYNTMVNRADSLMFTLSGAGGAYVTYTYDAAGSVIRKQLWSSGSALASTIDYIGGFVYTTSGTTTTLSYIQNSEGRIINNSGTLTAEYVISDQQGNARFSFSDNGKALVIRQENSYYAFGEQLAGSPVTPLPTTPNINLYNGGSEWQAFTSNLPDYNQTLFRNYDPAIGRFIAVDPSPESADGMNVYQYGGNNPVMGNDPDGGVASAGNEYGQNHATVGFTHGLNEFDISDYFNNEADAEMANWNAQQAILQKMEDEASAGGSSGAGDASGTNGGNGATDVSANASGSSPTISTDFIVTGGIVHVDDGSNAVFDTRNGTFDFEGFNDQGGVNEINWSTLSNIASIMINGDYTFIPMANMLQQVNVRSTRSNKLAEDVDEINKVNALVGYVPIFVSMKGFKGIGFGIGIVSGAVTVGTDVYGYIQYRKNPNSPAAVSPAKAILDGAILGIGFTDAGGPIAADYFLIDAYYPGGWPAYMKEQNDLNQYNSQYNLPSTPDDIINRETNLQ